MALTTDPAVGSWVLVSRFAEPMWLQVTAAGNGALYASNPIFPPVAWPPLVSGAAYGPISYSEVLQVAASQPGASTPAETIPDATTGGGITTSDPT